MMEFLYNMSISWLIFTVFLSPKFVEPTFKCITEFNDYNNLEFINFAVYKSDGKIFIFLSAVNHLYQLSSDLKFIGNASTGPRETNCSNTDRSNSTNRCLENTDNYNKILFIDRKFNKLLSCGAFIETPCSAYSTEFDEEFVEQKPKRLPQSAVVTNSKVASTVAFIYRKNNQQGFFSLYVANSYSDRSPNQHDVPALAVRTLQSELSTYLTVLSKNENNFTQHRDKFKVQYVYGFSSGQFIYLLTTQLDHVDGVQKSHYISKLIRICQSNEKHSFPGYSEIPIQCSADENSVYDLAKTAYVDKPGTELANSLNITSHDAVLFAVFSQNQDIQFNSNTASNRSALCVYSIKAINEKFDENLRSLFNQPEYRQNIDCGAALCNSGMNELLMGSILVTASPVETFDLLVTAIISTRNKRHTTLFLGTNSGYLKKLVMNRMNTTFQYPSILIDERHPVIKLELLHNAELDYLYVMTKHKLIRYTIGGINCYKYRTYDECIQSGIQYCGWCGLKGECTSVYNCDQSDFSSWIINDFRKNVNLTILNGPEFSVESTIHLKLSFNKLPLISEEFFCVFDAKPFSFKPKSWLTNAVLFDQSSEYKLLSCPVIKNGSQPIVLDGDHLNVTVSISTHSIERIVTAEIALFNCSTYKSYVSCNSLKFTCRWLTIEGICSHQLSDNFLSNNVVTSSIDKLPSKKYNTTSTKNINKQNLSNCSVYHVSDSCVKASIPECGWCTTTNKCTVKDDCSLSDKLSWISNNIRDNFSFHMVTSKHLQFGRSENITLTMVNGSDLIRSIDVKLYCLINVQISTLIILSNVTMDEETKKQFIFTCKAPAFDEIPFMSYQNHTQIARLSVIVSTITTNITDIWSTEIQFTDGCNSYVSLLECINISSKYECHWCRIENICTHNITNCDRNKSNDVEIEPLSVTCSDTHSIGNNIPSVSSFFPNRGPWKGGTKITIEGENLYFLNEESPNSIIVAGRPCLLVTDTTNSSKKIDCIIDKSNSSKDGEGPVEIHVNGVIILSENNFTFVNLKITSVTPNQGPIYGGTNLTITGENVGTGRNIDVLVGNISCTVFLRQSNRIECITSPSPNVMQPSEIKLIYDNSVDLSTNESYTYVLDPERDEKGFNIEPKGIPAGGVTILIRNMEVSPSFSIYLLIHNNDEIYNASCERENNNSSTTFACKSPRIPNIDNNPTNIKFPVIFNVSVMSLGPSGQSITIPSHQSKFYLYPNPGFLYFFNSSVVFSSNKYVIIIGRYINEACQKEDIHVSVGNRSCKVISLSTHQLICQLPYLQTFNHFTYDLEEEYDDLREYETIIVSIGEHFKRTVHKQSFSHGNDTKLSPFIYVVIIVGVLAIIIIIAFHLTDRKKIATRMLQKLKTAKQEKEYLELNVALECKEAFAELQTQTSLFTLDSSCDNLPFLSYRNYVMNILFPNIGNCSAIVSGKTILIHEEEGLRLFEDLIKNKVFLLTFIRTIEKDEHFSMNDRVFVASMIMLTLNKDLEYSTDILKILMTELIAKYSQGENHPKLLLRRTESIVEKMLSAWLSILLYKFLSECAGRPLYNLFNAVKLLVNKGPIDMITSEARYCLNENKIIRQKIEFQPLTIYVNVTQQVAILMKLESAMEKVSVKVLDCDTISQVREKIFDVILTSINYGQRPNLSEVHIELLNDTSERIILFDDDSNSKIEGKWRQKNTLRHYGISDKSILNLIILKHMNLYPSSTTGSINDAEKGYVDNLSMPSSSRCSESNKVNSSESASTSMLDIDVYYKEWHLVKPPNADDTLDSQNNVIQVVPEIYLTRLLAMKSALKPFVDDLFEIIFKKNRQNNCFPTAIKFMFDFLDNQALQNGITDPEVLHVWKTNCLPLRFWVNLIKNPNFLFDVHKSNIADSCLSVIAQAFMDSCSTTENYLNKDSATTRLLYAKEIPIYKKWVEKYYADIKNMSSVSPQEMSVLLVKESKSHANDFDTYLFLDELYKHTAKYKHKLISALEDTEIKIGNLLAFKFKRVIDIMSSANH